MATAKLHPSLPAPVVHASYLTSSRSKSHVLAGVQDAYWSDEETEDAECPLCLEEMDVSDLNFKPCQCGYQICRFCWHHIKENLNGRCPACRREYTNDAVQFKAIAKEDHKRLTQQKKQRDRERKELDALNRRHLLNVRVVQRNVVYVVGIGSRFAKEELIPTLRSNDYFGQYGKISKILLVKRTPPGGGAPVVGLYVTYHRREDAARAIAAVDGSPPPGGAHGIMRASHGTTKYCIAFLRNVACNSNGCMDLHEWGDEKDCFTKEDLTTLKHTMKDEESRQHSASSSIKKAEAGDAGYSRTHAWGTKGPTLPPSVYHNGPSSTKDGPFGPTRRGHRPSRSGGTESRSQMSAGRILERRTGVSSTKTPSQASSSRPSTPSLPAGPRRPTSPLIAKQAKREAQSSLPSRSRSSSVAVLSDAGSGSGSQDATSAPTVEHAPKADVAEILPAADNTTQTRQESPPSPLALASGESSSNPSYQMSTQARALLDDVRARRESVLVQSNSSPFPDLDRTLQVLTDDDGVFGGFNFNLDPKLASNEDVNDDPLPDFDESLPPNASYSDRMFSPFQDMLPMPNSQSASIPGSFPNSPNLPFIETSRIAASMMAKRSASSSSYSGSFNPFAEGHNERSGSPARTPSVPPGEEGIERKMSRFGFARERQGMSLSNTSSPLHSADASIYSPPDSSLPSSVSAHAPWPFQRLLDPMQSGIMPPRTTTPSSLRNSPLVPPAGAHPIYSPQTSRFQPFDMPSNEVSLKDLIGVGRQRPNPGYVTSDVYTEQQSPLQARGHQPFQDPVILTSVPYMGSSYNDHPYQHSSLLGTGFTPLYLGSQPESMPNPPQLLPPMVAQSGHEGPMLSPNQPRFMGYSNENQPSNASNVSLTIMEPAEPPPKSPVLTQADFPALPATSTETQVKPDLLPQPHIVPRTVAKDTTKIASKAKKAVSMEKLADKGVPTDQTSKLRPTEQEQTIREIESGVTDEKVAKKGNSGKAEKKVGTEQSQKIKGKKTNGEKTSIAANKKVELATQSSHNSPEEYPPMSALRTAAAKPAVRNGVAKAAPAMVTTPLETHVPILSRMPKKSKTSAAKVNRTPKDDDTEGSSSVRTAPTPLMDDAVLPNATSSSASEHHPSEFDDDRAGTENDEPSTTPFSLRDLFEKLHQECPQLNLSTTHPFFDMASINPAANLPTEYSPLVQALSSLSVNGGSFADSVPSDSIDNAVSSFQQLLETLTQTISDLLRLLPRTTWDDSSSFDGVLRDMLKGDDFLEDVNEEQGARDDEVAALTLALERRAKWMEVQLAKLEELHRDINKAAVRAVLGFNDRGWDPEGALPRVGNSLEEFDKLGQVEEEDGTLRPMTIPELKAALAIAKQEEAAAEEVFRQSMIRMQEFKPGSR